MAHTFRMTLTRHNAVSHLDYAIPNPECQLIPGDVIDGWGIYRWSRPTHNFPHRLTMFMHDELIDVASEGVTVTVRRAQHRPTPRFITDAARAFYDYLVDVADPGQFPDGADRDAAVFGHVRTIVDDITYELEALADDMGEHVCPIADVVDRTFAEVAMVHTQHPDLPAHRVASAAVNVLHGTRRYDTHPCPLRAVVDDVATLVATALLEGSPTPPMRRQAMDGATSLALAHHTRPIETILADADEYGVAMAKTVTGHTDGFGESVRYMRSGVTWALTDAVAHAGYGTHLDITPATVGWNVVAAHKRR